jgi:acyl-CoA reductase-like NAD-dependent aldehyde dehydrogenase
MDALTGDVWTCVEIARYYEKNAARILAKERRAGHRLSPGSDFLVEQAPLGLVAIFGPWNYPLQLALIPAITALVAGNAVILKPSERAPLVGELIANLLGRVGFPPGLVQVVQGGADVGQAILDSRPDKVFFTGSPAVGRQILAAAAPNLTPVDLELGGKAPMLVFADANMERAARAAVWGAFVNAGQVCVGVERLYVEASAHDAFVALVRREVAVLKVGTDPDDDVGPLIAGFHADHVESLVDDAVKSGAEAATPRRRERNLVHPVILTKVNHTMRIMREETFGPVLPIMAFEDEAEAVRLANDSAYGLGAYVFTADLERGRRVAHQLVVGTCAINDVVKSIANPDVPFGGQKDSGFGRYHGPEGLKAFSRPLALMVNAGTRTRERNWFPTRTGSYNVVRSALTLIYGGGKLSAAWKLITTLVARRRVQTLGSEK